MLRPRLLVLLLPWALLLSLVAEGQRDVSEGLRVDDPVRLTLRIAEALHQAGHDAKAAQLYRQATQQAAGPAERLVATERLALLLREQGALADGAALYRETLADSATRADTAIYMLAQQGLARELNSGGQHIEAIRLQRQVEQWLLSRVDTASPGFDGRAPGAALTTAHLSSLEADMAATLLEAGDVKEAQTRAERAQRLADGADLTGATYIQDIQARLFARLGQYEAAYERLLSCRQLDARLRRELVSRAAATTDPLSALQSDELKAQFDQEAREQQELLEAASRRHAAARNVAVALAVALAAVLAVGAYLAARQRRKWRDDARLHQRIASMEGLALDVAQTCRETNAALLERLDDALAQDPSQKALLRARDMAAEEGVLLTDQVALRIRDLPRPVNVANVFREVASQLEDALAPRRLTLVVGLEPTLMARVVEEQIRVVARNVIGGSIKNVAKGGQIRLSGMTHGGRTTLVVEAAAMSRPAATTEEPHNPHDLESVFDPYDRLKMQLCQRLCEVNHGELLFERPVKGTRTFTIVLPA